MAEPSTPVCSVVIPTFDAAGTLGAQLEALVRQRDAPPFEVVVADNGSTDDSAAVALRWSNRLDIRVVDASRGRGVSVARNVGVAAARTDVVLVCDADDVVSEGWVRALLDALAHADLVGGPLETASLSGELAASWAPLPTRTTALPEIWGLAYPVGGNTGFRRVVWEQVGGFDEAYGAGAEEIDFAWRARDAGHPASYAPEALVHYRMRSDLRGVLRQQHQSGLGTARLYATFRPAGVTTRSWHRRLRHELALLRRVPLRGGRAALGGWLASVAFEAGVARGALRHRRRMP